MRRLQGSYSFCGSGARRQMPVGRWIHHEVKVLCALILISVAGADVSLISLDLMCCILSGCLMDVFILHEGRERPAEGRKGRWKCFERTPTHSCTTSPTSEAWALLG